MEAEASGGTEIQLKKPDLYQFCSYRLGVQKPWCPAVLMCSEKKIKLGFRASKQKGRRQSTERNWPSEGKDAWSVRSWFLDEEISS